MSMGYITLLPHYRLAWPGALARAGGGARRSKLGLP